MVDQDRNIQTEGGSYTKGNVSTGADFVGRDKHVYNQTIQLDLEKLTEILNKALPPGDPLPRQLLEALKQFKSFHTQLFEWKELHNYLNDILYVLGQFTRHVDRLDQQKEALDLRLLLSLWRPVSHKVELLLDFAASVKYIAEAPFLHVPAGLQGPVWAVELYVSRTRLDELLRRREAADPYELTDAAFEFSDLAEKHMFLADKQLRQTSAELYNLSSIVLGNIGDA